MLICEEHEHARVVLEQLLQPPKQTEVVVTSLLMGKKRDLCVRGGSTLVLDTRMELCDRSDAHRFE